MIKPDLSHCSDIHEFYSEIKRIQSGAHGEEYIEHHKALISCAKQCETIKEIGVCQGGTLAALLTTNPKKLTGIDILPKYFQPYQSHFDKYAQENNVEFDFISGDSLDQKLVSQVDMLHIDSLHEPDHLMKELIIHAPHVKKYIVFHDTANFATSRGLFVTIAKYITKIEQSWKVVDHYIHRVGYTVIERCDRIEYKGK